MNALKSLWSAFANLANSLNRLAFTVDQVNDLVQQRVGDQVVDVNDDYRVLGNGDKPAVAGSKVKKR